MSSNVTINFRKKKKKYTVDLIKYSKNYNNYLNIYFIYQDLSILKFIKVLLVKNGNKSKAFKSFFKILKLIKQITCISPIRIIKNLLNTKRILFTYYTKKRGNIFWYIPKIKDSKRRFMIYLYFLKNKLSKMHISKKFSLEEKLTYLIVDEILNKKVDWKEYVNSMAVVLHNNKHFLKRYNK